jgi:hypothetical protein
MAMHIWRQVATMFTGQNLNKTLTLTPCHVIEMVPVKGWLGMGGGAIGLETPSSFVPMYVKVIPILT